MSFNNDFSKTFDLFQYAVVNPQIAMLSFLNMANEVVKHPEKIEKARNDLMDRFINLAEYTTRKMLKEDTTDLEIKNKDRRFNEPEWDENLPLSIIKQYYLSLSEWLTNCVNDTEAIDRKLYQQTAFHLKQYLDALHPSNFPMLNPTVVKKTIEENGENFKKGLEMFLSDVKNGAITTNDMEFFTIGKDLASTNGKVIYKNYLIELIQYEATTENVYKTPLLFVPPWINKFYILDLGLDKSFVKWLVDKGFTVFMISWANPDARYRDIGFEDYAKDGVIAALNKIAEITKETYVNAIGYCVGGTLLSSLLSVINDKKFAYKPKIKVKTATLLTTPLDFEHAGDLTAFMNDSYLKLIDSQMKQLGFMEGRTMYNTFSALKANDMVWRYMINSYMLGNKPTQHSTLYWNADCTNLTQKMQTFLAKTLYRDNQLKEGNVTLFGIPVDISKIKQPVYMFSTVKDHLVPWKATFDGLKLFKSLVKFVVGGSGHVAGVINPPDQKKYNYWTNEKNDYTNSAQWMSDAVEHAGSWWLDWFDWMAKQSEEMIPARKIIDAMYDAPGKYVVNELPEDIDRK